jgi:subtilisin family serine protease
MKRTLSIIITLIAIFVLVMPVAAKPNDVDGKGNADKKVVNPGVYIVEMAGQPVVAYDGGIPGLKATRPAKGEKINPYSQEVKAYVGFLNSTHDAALNSVGGGEMLYNYNYAFNGFAAKVTPAQAAKLALTPGVLAVTTDELLTLDTSSTPTFLGLDAPGGLWSMGVTGEDVIIGIVDGGVWPEHPSFSDRTGARPGANPKDKGKLSYQQIPGWHGKCVPGEEFNASMCNQKLIGAQYYNAGWGGNAGIDAQLPWEYNSPRDFGGHGTHTASTAGGNSGVMTTGPASVFGKISGIAPRARIAAYKVCWETGAGGSCFNTDSVAAIDQAVADGVDVINFSISGSRTNFRDPVEIAFMYAADAGVFVAASAGNSGPTTSTVAHPGPWLTTVAAGTHNRNGAGSVTLGNGATYSGASVATAVGPAPFIDSTAAGLPGADPTQVALCYSTADTTDGMPVLDPEKVMGKIVLCDRGVIARVNKSLAVMEAGGVGMVLVNTSASSLNADFHFVPTVHLQNIDRAAVKAYAATPGATATINQATIVYTEPAPFTASFSSRGPLQAGGGDLLKPDLIAPGQDVLAGVAPPGNNGRLFDLYSGTSMSSPHVAGLAALMMDAHPDWTPMMIKSALMTTGYDVLDGGTPAPNTNPVLIFRQGAGHVDPNKAVDPGLVFNHGWNDWLAFICATQPQGLDALCAQLWGMGYSKDASDLNVASIAIGDMAGIQTVTRKVTNVSDSKDPATYTISYTGMAGFNVVVEPATLTLNPGETKSFTVTFTRITAALNAYTGGQLYLTHGPHVVRVPMVVRPVALAAPAEVTGSGASGSITFPIKFGYDGVYTAGVHGLNPATTFEGTVMDDPTDTFVPGGPGTISFDVVVPAGTAYARFQLFDEFTDGEDDLDLYVYKGATLVGSSGGGTSAEQVNLVLPAAATYTVWVHGWGTDGPDAKFTLFTWQFGLVDDAGNMTVTAPAAAVTGPAEITVDWAGLMPAKYLGAVSHSGPSGLLGLTVVNVSVP